MVKDDFVAKRIEGRKLLLGRIVDRFKLLSPTAIHLFGSGAQGFQDEFSDIDIWITVNDKDMESMLKKLPKLLPAIAPIIVKHHSRSWSPVGGRAYSVIHYVHGDLFVVDYYVSKRSETILKRDSIILYGDDSLKRGKWRLNRHISEKVKDTHTMRKDIDLLLSLIVISLKGIVRDWEDDSFITTLRTVHEAFRKKYKGKIKPRRLRLTFRSGYKLLNDLYSISNMRQKKAIGKIRNYANRVEGLYG